MSESAKPDWLRVIRYVVVTLIVFMLLIQLFPALYSVKDFWLVSVPSSAFWQQLLPHLLLSPGFWKVLVTSAEGLATSVVLILVFLRPTAAWKAYLVCAALTIASAVLFFVFFLPSMPERATAMIMTGSLFSLFRSGITLGLLYALALLSGRVPPLPERSAHA